MNNPLAQKAQYYLNESHRLSEELKSEEAYSELLENVLFELLGEEDFTKLFEYVMQGTLTHDEKGTPLSPERAARRAKRVGQIRSIGQAASLAGNRGLRDRAAFSIVAKGGDAVRKRGDDPGTDDETIGRKFNVTSAIKDRSPMHITQGEDPENETNVRKDADRTQRGLSSGRRAQIRHNKGLQGNTF